jgi:hypothetical protein
MEKESGKLLIREKKDLFRKYKTVIDQKDYPYFSINL